MRRARTRLGVALVGLVLSGCSLLTSLEGYSGGVRPDGADASPDGEPPGAVDAGADVEADASSDASPDASFCESLVPAPTFCDDFDRDPDGGWDEVFLDHATLTLDGTDVRSAPNALLAVSPVDTAGVNVNAYRNKAFHVVPSAFTVAFDVKVDQFEVTGATAGLAGIGFEETETYLVVIVDKKSTINLYETLAPGTGINHNAADAHLIEGQWTRVQIDVTLPPSTKAAEARLTLDGETVLEFELSADFPREAPALGLGFVYNDKPGWRVRYDNVVLRLTPK